ncbi:MAG: DUF2029 domain-containing protein [Lewinellaceae bacterium]|nr:DUF2029 domain-containing protein [Lewinellaceae bacterium]
MMMWAQRFLKQDRTLWIVYLLVAEVVSLQSLLQRVNAQGYTAYENYVIFKNSFAHLVQGLNPYTSFPAEQWDLFKYSPVFSVAMAPFSVLPDWAGLQFWNLANALPLLWAILRLPILEPRQRRFVAWFVLPELIISLQNSQSNGLTAAFILWAWVAIEAGKPVWSAGWAAAGGFLKIFGIFAAVPALIYPQWRVYVPAVALWSVLLVSAPLVVVSPEQLWQVYQWWLELLRSDHSASVGLSVMGWLQTWFGWEAPKVGVTAAGMVLFVAGTWAVYSRRAPGPDGLPPATDRILLWASLLLWVVIFNHKAESPTFIIALCGVALWYQSAAKPALWMKILLWTAFLLASVSPSDIFPRMVRTALVQPYVLKAVPCIAIWIILTVQLLRPPAKKQSLASDE